MKNSKEYSKKITALYQSLKRKNTKVFQVETQTVVDSLIYGIISEKLTEKETEIALSKFKGYFVDWNDLRVSKLEEIQPVRTLLVVWVDQGISNRLSFEILHGARHLRILELIRLP